MSATPSFEVSRLIRRLRDESGLTQGELANRVGTTQSVISRLESDDYEGHSLSMLYRIAAALDRKVVVEALPEGKGDASVRERSPSYATSSPPADDTEGLSRRQLDRLAERLVQRFGEHGVREADVEEAIRWARGAAGGRSVTDLQGAIEVGTGDVVDDVRRARALRGGAPRRAR